jgi:O-antigen/teichoic acid export membrane protein
MSSGVKNKLGGLMISTVFGRFVNIVFTISGARILGPVAFGTFALVQATASLVDTLSNLGADYGFNYIASSNKGTEVGDIRGLFRGLCQICLLTSLFITVLMGVFSRDIRAIVLSLSSSADTYYVSLILLCGILITESFYAIGWEVPIVMQDIRLLSCRNSSFSTRKVVIMFTGMIIGGLNGLLWGWLGANICNIIALNRILNIEWLSYSIVSKIEFSNVRRLLGVGKFFYLGNLVNGILSYYFLVYLSISHGLFELGGLKVAQFFQQIVGVLSSSLAPVLFIKLRNNENNGERIEYMREPLIALWALMIIVYYLYSIFDKSIVDLLFGKSYLNTLMANKVAIIAAIIECVYTFVAQITLANGNTAYYGFVQNVSTVLSGIACILLIHPFGLVGYLIGKLICFTSSLGMHFAYLRKDIRFFSDITILAIASILDLVVCKFTATSCSKLFVVAQLLVPFTILLLYWKQIRCLCYLIYPPKCIQDNA